MENKKLLKYLLKDLSELDEMFAEKGKYSFDEFEIEFIQNRVTGAKRLVQLFLEKENEMPPVVKTETAAEPNVVSQNVAVQIEKPKNIDETISQELNNTVKTPEVRITEMVREVVAEKVGPGNELKEKKDEILTEGKTELIENNIVTPEVVQESGDKNKEESEVKEYKEKVTHEKQVSAAKEIQLEDEEPFDIHNKRLGDSFSKEKSVNDLRSDDSSKLEHKLSNRPVASIQSAIGINDRFQYIRELFEGSADNFVKAVSDLDSMGDIKDAVDYLQTNFKWKKNETSLKFISLIKRRFPNE